MYLSLSKTISTFVTLLFLLVSNSFSETHHRIKIEMDGRSIQELASLGVALEIADFKPGVFVVGEFSGKERQQISEAGFSYEVLIEDMTTYYQERNRGLDRDAINEQIRMDPSNKTPYPTPENFTLGSMGGFHTYDEVLDDLDAMHALFPELISPKEPIGETNTIEGRPVYWVRISSNPDNTQNKPRVLYTALTHAREPASMQQMLFQMWYLLENYDSDPEIQYLVDNLEMYFVPVVNPDGYIQCENTHPNGGSMHRKNMRTNSDGSIGVDLNRNFGYEWGHDNDGSSPNPSAQTYRGTEPFSEPETQLQKELAEEYNFILALNNHTYSDLLIYPWGYNDQLTPDSDIFIAYADLMTRENNYIYGTVHETLNYFANGGSDDWFYGEQETKDKTFAFTPEAGSPADGFWPAMDRIEDICAGHTHMNMSLAWLALPYAEIDDISSPYIAEKSTSIHFEVVNMGKGSPANYTVSLTPLSNTIEESGEPVSLHNMEILEAQQKEIDITLQPDISPGDEISYILTLDNGSYQWHDTIIKFYGHPEVLFFDPSDNLDNWETETWDISYEEYYSAPGSIADSPGENYPNNANNPITTAQSFDLGNSDVAWIEFYTRFDIEKNWDYVQFLYSTDNQQTWSTLEGNYTEEGSSNQIPGEPLYHGKQIQWVKEEVDISHLAGEEDVWFRFVLVSDGWINEEGFYFDDFKLTAVDLSPVYSFFPPEEVSFYQHQELSIDFSEYISWESEGEVSLSWQGNENVKIESLNETTVMVSNINPHWTGQETLTFSLSDNLADLEQEVLFIVKEVPAPQIVDQQEIQILKGEQLQFEAFFLFVEDDFFTYPDDFTITLHPGSNYEITNDFIIEPHQDFTGKLTLPVTIHNGFRESEPYDFEIFVSPETAIDEFVDDVAVYFDENRRELVINATKDGRFLSQKVTITDMTGRIVLKKPAKGNMRINLESFQTGAYVVAFPGTTLPGIKIMIP